MLIVMFSKYIQKTKSNNIIVHSLVDMPPFFALYMIVLLPSIHAFKNFTPESRGSDMHPLEICDKATAAAVAKKVLAVHSAGVHGLPTFLSQHCSKRNPTLASSPVWQVMSWKAKKR